MKDTFVNTLAAPCASTSTIGRLITNEEFENDDSSYSDRIVIFNDNPGRGRFYVSLITLENEAGNLVGHRFEAMEFDGSCSDETCFDDIDDAVCEMPRPCYRDADRMATAFMKEVYPRLLTGEIDLIEGQHLTDDID